MTTIGYATLQIIPSLKGVTEAISQQVEGKAVEVKVVPQVDQRAAETAGKQAKEGVEKHTREVKVEPKVDQRAAEDAGKKAGDAVAKGASGSSTAIGQAVTGALEGAGGEAGRRLGEKLSDAIPTGMTGAARRIGDALRNNLPAAGQIAGTVLGTAIGVAVTDAIGKERLDRAGQAVLSGLSKAVKAANAGTDIGVAIANSVAGGLSSASSVVGGAAATIMDTISGIGSALDTTKQLLGGDDSWAAPGLDFLNDALGKAGPLLEGIGSAATLAGAGAQVMSTAAGIATKAQVLWNIALTANPIGLIVAAIAALVAGIVLFFTKTEIGRKIWEGFTEYLKVAWAGIKIAFSVAWDAIRAIWEGMVTKAGEVWEGIKSRFTAVVDFVKGLPSAIGAAASGMWDGLKNGLVSVLNWIGDKWNSFADTLSIDLPGTALDVTIPRMPTFGGGGYTGNTAADKVAGVVHGGEFVVRKESTDLIQNAYPGLLDYLNNSGALPGYEAGGLVASAKQFAKSMDSARYLMGGFSPAAIDCSGFVSAVANVATGRSPFESRMSTVTEGSWLKSLGFKPGRGGPGDLRVGWWDKGGGANGHTAGTFPDGTNFESNGSEGVVVGGPTGANDGQFTQHAHLPIGGTTTTGGATTGGGAVAGLSVLGLGAGGSSSSAAPEAASSSSKAPAATATSGGGESKISIPGSLSGFASWGGQFAGDQVKSAVTDANGGQLPSELETAVGGLGDLGAAAGSFVDGQISSALGVFGIGESPGWLKGISTLVSGFGISGKNGSIGGSPGAGAALSGQGAGASAAPLAAQTIGTPTSAALGSVHGGSGGQPGPVTNYNIRTATVEDSFLQSQRIEKERAAARLSRF